jgi:hypothetical protein
MLIWLDILTPKQIFFFGELNKRLEAKGLRKRAERIDSVAVWLYPLLYLGGAALAYWFFLADGFHFVF